MDATAIPRLSMICHQIEQLIAHPGQVPDQPRIVRKLVKRALRSIQELDRSTSNTDLSSIKSGLAKATQSMIVFINEAEYTPGIIYDDMCALVRLLTSWKVQTPIVVPATAPLVSGYSSTVIELLTTYHSANANKQIPGPSGIGRARQSVSHELRPSLFKKDEYIPTPVFDELHKLGGELKGVYERLETWQQHPTPELQRKAALYTRRMIKGAIKMLKDILCEHEMIGYLDDEYRRQLEVTGEALIDYLEAKNDDAPQYRNRLSHKLEHVMKSMNMELTTNIPPVEPVPSATTEVLDKRDNQVEQVEEQTKEKPLCESKSVQAILIDSIVPPNTPLNLSLKLVAPEPKQKDVEPVETKLVPENKKDSPVEVSPPKLTKPAIMVDPTDYTPFETIEIGNDKKTDPIMTTIEKKSKKQAQPEETDLTQDIDPILGFFLGASPSTSKTNKSPKKTASKQVMTTPKPSKTRVNNSPTKRATRSASRLSKQPSDDKALVESKSIDSLTKEVTVVKQSLSELETTLKMSLKHDLNDLTGEIKKLIETEIKRLHQRFDQADASMKIASEADLTKEFESQISSLANQIGQLSKGINHTLLNKMQHLDDKTEKLAGLVDTILTKQNESTVKKAATESDKSIKRRKSLNEEDFERKRPRNEPKEAQSKPVVSKVSNDRIKKKPERRRSSKKVFPSKASTRPTPPPLFRQTRSRANAQ